jgi:hypothetical protein
MNPFTFSAFAAWCRTKPADENYDWCSDRCAAGQYADHLGEFQAWDNRHTEGANGQFWVDASVAAFESPERTFGALAQFLESMK